MIDNATDQNTTADLIHELRTPLTGVMGFAELLLENEELTGKDREYLEIILSEAQNMAAILDSHSKG